MHRLERRVMRTLLAVTLVTSTAPALPHTNALDSSIVPLSEAELAATWGGVYGGRIGQENGGILELSCGAEDLWPAGAPPLWESRSGTVFRECDVDGRPHFLPRYASPADVSVVVGGVITKLTGTGGTPRIRVFVNGNPAAVATVPCTPRFDYPTGTALGINGNPNRDVNSWACPDNNLAGNHYGVSISLANAGLRPGLNVVRAVTEAAIGVDDDAQDQEVRFFCVGDDDCLPARIELRPVANGALNQFEYPPIANNPPRWQLVNDYPDPVNPTQSCAPLGVDFIAHATFGSVRTELFQLGGTVPPGLTFSSCTLKAHMRGSGEQCTPTTSYLVVRNSVGTTSDGAVLPVYYWDFPQEMERKMTTNPFTGTSWKSADLANLQAGVKDDSTNSNGMDFSDLLMECTF